MNRILIIGATSAIAQATARRFADDGATLFLVGRTPEKLEAVAQDLSVRGAEVDAFQLDVNDFEQHEAMLEAADAALDERMDAALIAHGHLPDQDACEASVEATLDTFSTNALSVIALLTRLAPRFEVQQRGCLAAVSSVAGDRGRASNYVYGSAKAAVSTFMEGLHNRLSGTGARVLTVKPGFVDTPMTAGLSQNALYVQPETVGGRIYQAMKTGEGVLYVPRFWRYVMYAVRAIPERIFKRLSL